MIMKGLELINTHQIATIYTLSRPQECKKETIYHE